jgi:hypothetical protein
MPSELMGRPETLQLMRLYYAICDKTVRRQVLAIVEAVAEATAPKLAESRPPLPTEPMCSRSC